MPTLGELNRTTLARQHLLARADGSVAEVIDAVGGLQAQHADMPYLALWSRRTGQKDEHLESALTARDVVRATLMRSTLHLVPAERWAELDVVSAAERLATWRASARRAGVDLVALNAEIRELCRSAPRTVDEIEAFAAERHPGVDVADAVPGGVRRPWWRLTSAGGGLVHVPPSGLRGHHGPPSYADGATVCASPSVPDLDAARVRAVVGYLSAFGPASRADIAHGLGIGRVTPVKAALAEIDARVLEGPDGTELFDLPDGEIVAADEEAPVRFLPRWEHLLVALRDRSRFLDDDGVSAVYRRNGDILATFWVDGRVAGTWSIERTDDRAELRLAAISDLATEHRDAVEAEAQALLGYLVDDTADDDGVLTWA